MTVATARPVITVIPMSQTLHDGLDEIRAIWPDRASEKFPAGSSPNTLSTRTLLGGGGNGLRRAADFVPAIDWCLLLAREPMAFSCGVNSRCGARGPELDINSDIPIGESGRSRAPKLGIPA